MAVAGIEKCTSSNEARWQFGWISVDRFMGINGRGTGGGQGCMKVGRADGSASPHRSIPNLVYCSFVACTNSPFSSERNDFSIPPFLHSSIPPES